MYHFEGRIARRDGYHISRDVSRAAKVTIIEGCVVCAIDAWKDMSPMGPRHRDNGCVSLGKTCITILYIASYGFTHFYYWWTWIHVLLNLLVFLCEKCDGCLLSCYWEYETNRVLLLSCVFGKLWVACSVEVQVGCKEYPYFVPLTCV